MSSNPENLNLLRARAPSPSRRERPRVLAQTAPRRERVVENNATTNGDYQTGMAVFTIAKGGLMFSADISGEKFAYTARPGN